MMLLTRWCFKYRVLMERGMTNIRGKTEHTHRLVFNYECINEVELLMVYMWMEGLKEPWRWSKEQLWNIWGKNLTRNKMTYLQLIWDNISTRTNTKVDSYIRIFYFKLDYKILYHDVCFFPLVSSLNTL